MHTAEIQWNFPTFLYFNNFVGKCVTSEGDIDGDDETVKERNGTAERFKRRPICVDKVQVISYN